VTVFDTLQSVVDDDHKIVTVPFTVLVNSEFGVGFAKVTEVDPGEDHCPAPLTPSNVAVIGTGVLTHP
jgi:hypothetical protein